MHNMFSTINYLRWSRLLRNSSVRNVLGSVLVLIILFSSALGVVHALPASSDSTVRTTTFTLDHVAVTVASPFLPTKGFDTALPGLPSQIASEVAWSPFREFSVTAIPFGTRSATELGIVARPGAANDFRSSLYGFRQRQHALQQTGPSALLFGKRVTSSVSLVSLKLDSVHVQPTTIVEWVVEAGQRIWLIRIAREEPSGTTTLASASQFLTSLNALSLASNTLTRPSAARAIPSQPIALPLPRNSSSSRSSVVGAQTDLPLPSWWNHGLCDTTLVRNSHPLGASYRGVLACGPGDAYVRNSKFPGSSQPYEWQSGELAFRYLYLAYKVSAYASEANNIVANYAGSYPFIKVANGTVGKAPGEGDVISFDTTSTVGHVGIVTDASVNSKGDGTITVLEQNGDPSGEETLHVRHWQVQSNESGTWASGWLKVQAANLSVPYISQYQGLPSSYCDCGPASVAMLARYFGKDGGRSDHDLVLDARNATGNTAGSCPGSLDTTFGNLENSLNHYNLPYSEISNSLSPQPDAQMQAMKDATDSGKPVIALVHGADLGRGSSYGDHWLVVKGFSGDGQSVYINDPDNQSANGRPGWIVGGSITLAYSTFRQAAYDAAPGPYGIIVGSGSPPPPPPTSTPPTSPPNPPTLQSPSNGAALNNRAVTFSWSAPNSPNLNGYTLHVSTTSTIDGSGANLILDTGVGSTSYTYTFSQDYTTLWWSVAAWNTSGQRSGFASAWTFSVNTNSSGPPGPPTLQSPSNGAALNNRAVTFSWSAPNSPNLNGYTLHVSTTSTIDGSGANLILDTGVGSTSYTYTFSQDYTTLWWGVATWNSSNQRSGFTSAWTLTVDTTPPTADWSVPVGDGQSYHCQDGQTVQLEATASDNISIQKVHFLILLRTTGVWVDLGYDFSAPYQSSIACNSLDLGLNQADTCAHDTAGNVSDCKVFWLYRDPADTQPPVVNWVAPTSNTQVYHCQTQMVQLQADASDNVGVVDVHFDRWDAVNLQVVDLGDAYSPPYVTNVGCTTLNFDWNQVDVTAYDAAGNSAGQYFWLSRDRTPSAPSNLTGQTDTCNRVVLTWTDNSDNEDGFNIYRNGSLIGRVASNVTTYRDNFLGRQGTYTYTITAYLGTLESAPTSAISVATLPPYIKIHCSFP